MLAVDPVPAIGECRLGGTDSLQIGHHIDDDGIQAAEHVGVEGVLLVGHRYEYCMNHLG